MRTGTNSKRSQLLSPTNSQQSLMLLLLLLLLLGPQWVLLLPHPRHRMRCLYLPLLVKLEKEEP
jgi:hypothetical protein